MLLVRRLLGTGALSVEGERQRPIVDGLIGSADEGLEHGRHDEGLRGQNDHSAGNAPQC